VTLWTPDGEYPVDRGREAAPGPETGPVESDGDPQSSQYRDIDPDAAAQMEEQLAESQAQLLAAPVGTVVSNHAMGLFELAALHLRAEDPDNARLPIDAMGLLVDNLGDRLAEHETLNVALTQLRMAFVEMKKQAEPDESDPDESQSDD